MALITLTGCEIDSLAELILWQPVKPPNPKVMETHPQL